MKSRLALSIGIALILGSASGAVARAPAMRDGPPCTPLLSGPRNGQRAILELGDRLADVAGKNHRSEQRLRKELAQDSTQWVDACGQIFFEEAPQKAGNPVFEAQTTSTLAYPAEQTFALHSRPGANRVLYIDFNGELVSNTAWNAGYTGGRDVYAPAFDLDGNPGTFITDEMAVIQNVWLRVAEDYAPFDIDVTTADPGLAAIDRNGSSDTSYGARALVTSDSVLYGVCGCPGVAYVGVFDATSWHQFYQPALVLQRGTGANPKIIAEVVAHEAGHNLGLSHDGTATTQYYHGQGAWAPIMGAGYYRPLSQWSRGDYASPTNTEDDFVVMQSNGAPLRADEAGNSRSAARALTSATPFDGYITSRTDTDWFSVSGSGQLTVDARVAPISPNLDLRVEVYDSSGTMVTAADPPTTTVTRDVASGLGVNLTTDLPAGDTYYVKLDGVGLGDPLKDGYSDYASVGAYLLTVTVTEPYNPPPPPPSSPPSPTPAPEGVTTPQLTITSSGSLAPAAQNSSYSQQLTASGGNGSYVWALATGSVPTGLTLSSIGLISGTPSKTGSYSFSARVSSGSASTTTSLSVSVTSPLTVKTRSVAAADLGVRYSASLSASGGTGAYTWSVDSGSLPPGLSLAGNMISGTPTERGNWSVVVRVTDSAGATAVSRTLYVAVYALSITTPALPGAMLGDAYSLQLTADGGLPGYSWTRASGSLPSGISLSSSGVISGTPSVSGTYTVTVKVSDSRGKSVTKTFTLVVGTR